jgi:hypothetical protein
MSYATYEDMVQTYRNKANQCKNLWEVELALTDIRETLKIWQEEALMEALNGRDIFENPYVSKLLCERDAYLDRYDALRNPKRKAR